ncbi:unnamed protein product [[Candida] boidinii]|nr:unnamed protein product [[Candida] boidinii]
MSLSSNELNYLIWRYLQEGGLEISAYALQDETKINSLDDKYGERTPIGCLVDLVQKGILYTKIRDLISFKETNKNLKNSNDDTDNKTDTDKIKSENNDNEIEDNNVKDIIKNSNKDKDKKTLVSSITSSLINSKYDKVSILDLQEELINMDFNLYNAVLENSILHSVSEGKIDADTETNENETKQGKIDEDTTSNNNNEDSIGSVQGSNAENTENLGPNSTIKDEEMKDIENTEEIEAKLKQEKEEAQKAKEKLEIENDKKEIEELNSLIQSDAANTTNATTTNGSSNMEIVSDENIDKLQVEDNDTDINNYTTKDLKFTNTSSTDTSKPSLKSYYTFDPSISNQWNPSHPDVIAWGQNDNHAKIAALSLNSEIKELNLIESKLLNFPLNCKKIISINWANQGHSLITSSENGELRLWDASGSIKFIMALHNSPVLCVKWNKKSSFILSLDIKNKTIIWDANTGKSIQHIDGFNMTSSPLHSSTDSVNGTNTNNNFISDIFSNDDLVMSKNFMGENPQQLQLPLPPPPPAPPAPPATSDQQSHVPSSAGDSDMMALSNSSNDHNSSSSNMVIDKSQNEHSLFGISPSSSSPLTSNNNVKQDTSSQDQILFKKQISTSQEDLQNNNDQILKSTDSQKMSDIDDLKQKQDHINSSQQATEQQKSNDSIDIINLGIDACWLDDHKFIIPGRSGSLLAFNLGESLPIGCLKGHEGVITKILYNEELKLLVSSSTDNTIRIWQGDNPNSCQILIGHSQSIVYIKWLKLTNDYPVLLSCSIDGTIRLWDVSSGDLISLTIANSGSPIFEASVSPDLKKLVTGDSNNVIKVWDIDSKMVLNKFFKIYKKDKISNNNCSKLLNLRLNLINFFELPEIENSSNNNKITCISWSNDSLKFSVSFSNSKSHIIKLDE